MSEVEGQLLEVVQDKFTVSYERGEAYGRGKVSMFMTFGVNASTEEIEEAIGLASGTLESLVGQLNARYAELLAPVREAIASENVKGEVVVERSAPQAQPPQAPARQARPAAKAAQQGAQSDKIVSRSGKSERDDKGGQYEDITVRTRDGEEKSYNVRHYRSAKSDEMALSVEAEDGSGRRSFYDGVNQKTNVPITAVERFANEVFFKGGIFAQERRDATPAQTAPARSQRQVAQAAASGDLDDDLPF